MKCFPFLRLNTRASIQSDYGVCDLCGCRVQFFSYAHMTSHRKHDTRQDIDNKTNEPQNKRESKQIKIKTIWKVHRRTWTDAVHMYSASGREQTIKHRIFESEMQSIFVRISQWIMNDEPFFFHLTVCCSSNDTLNSSVSFRESWELNVTPRQ